MKALDPVRASANLRTSDDSAPFVSELISRSSGWHVKVGRSFFLVSEAIDLTSQQTSQREMKNEFTAE